ncbi:MAG TPA: D-2-hydroxyacid dehydrogenase [Tepidisphaeraceae bacterium]|nr:D-2-hydroxyacid dehydrogenase [Tepidisphaeraceae bacterium]
MAQIVYLDCFTVNPGDLDWEPLRALGDCVLYDRTPPEQVIPRAAESRIVLVNKIVLDGPTIRALPQLRYIGVTATGYNIVDVEAAKERNIVVTNVPTYGTRSVVQMTFALLLELTQHVGHHAQTVREGRWSASPDFCCWDRPLIELSGLTMGIVGLGRIGAEVGRVAQAFGMETIAASARGTQHSRAGVKTVSLDELFATSDVVSLHCPLTPETQKLVNAKRLASMKPTALLINTSRGGLVADQDLADALNRGQIAGAAVDVLSQEPPPMTNPLISARNCYVTPHIAWATRAARSRLLQVTVENIRAYLAGTPENRVG